MDLAPKTSISPAIVTNQQHGKLLTHVIIVPAFNLGISQDANIVAKSPQTERSNGIVYRQGADGGWQDLLDTRYERIAPNGPGEEAIFQPVNMVEVMLKEIDKIVWQLDAGNLDILLDIHDHEIRTQPKTSPSKKQKNIQRPIHDAWM